MLTSALAGCSGGNAPEALATPPTEPAAAPALPPVEVANAAPPAPLDHQGAFRLLEQGTFGPAPSATRALMGRNAESWVDHQMSLPATYLGPALAQALAKAPAGRWNEYVNIWWRNTLLAEDQLRQRVAFALSEIFVVGASSGLGDEQPGLANYYDTLLRHAFGNYRDLLEDVTLSPVMGEYLSMKGNHKADPVQNIRPDENYARELLQLFSIGLSRLNADGTPMLDDDGVPLPSYDQTTVEEFARVFTGWHFANADHFRWPRLTDYVSPMVAWPDYHDTASKTLLMGRTLPAGQSPEQDLANALDNIFEHPNVGPFIAHQLIQRLVTSNPSPEYVRDVADVFDRNAAGKRGELGSVIKAILLHREARLGHQLFPDTFGKLKEPLIRISSLWRAFETRDIPADFNYGWAAHELAQAPLNSPSVFNFFRPDFSQPGEIQERSLLSPEFEILDEATMIMLTSRLLANSIWSHNRQDDVPTNRIVIDISAAMQLEPDIEALLDELDQRLLGGRMTESLRQAVTDMMAERSYTNAAAQRVVEAIFLIISSPEAAVQI